MFRYKVSLPFCAEIYSISGSHLEPLIVYLTEMFTQSLPVRNVVVNLGCYAGLIPKFKRLVLSAAGRARDSAGEK